MDRVHPLQTVPNRDLARDVRLDGISTRCEADAGHRLPLYETGAARAVRMRARRRSPRM